jgi:L-Ala-D/L-Glu epimerase
VKISYTHYRLKFKHTFHIAAGARDFTDVVYVKLESNSVTGYGEVALPPYLKDSVSSVTDFLKQVEMPTGYNSSDFDSLLKKWNAIKNICYPALAALDIALHDLQGKLLGKSITELYNIPSLATPDCAYTIGMSSMEEMQIKLEDASAFRFFKLKMGNNDDAAIARNFRSLSKRPFCVDANRGWKEIKAAAELCNDLQLQGCVFAEQPFEKDMLEETALLRKQTALPIVLDESVQLYGDVEVVKNYCDGINVKLAKCGGLFPAYRMIQAARAENLKVFIGCMSEGSCSCNAAAQLSPLADWVDLDGPLLSSNDPFTGMVYDDGKIILGNKPGTGVILKEGILEF